MYNSWSPTPSQSFSVNNPFAELSASSRFPALEAPQGSSYQTPSPYPQPSTNSPGQFVQPSYGFQQASPSQQQLPQWQPQNPGLYNQAGYSSAQPQPSTFGGYGSQYGQSNLYGQQSQFIGQPQYSSPVSPQYQQNVVNEFDPFARSAASGLPSQPANPGGGGGWSSQPQSNIVNQFQRTGPNGYQHPRTFIQSNKTRLETWDPSIWNQALVTFEELKKAWEKQRADLQKRLLGSPYITSEESAYLTSLVRQAESNIDTAAVALFQMQEVSSSYKNSLDAAGKARIRGALNTALRELPDWP